MSAVLALACGPVAFGPFQNGLRIIPSNDKAYIAKIMYDPSIYPFISDDNSPNVGKEMVIAEIMKPHYEALCVFDGDLPCGAFVFEVHDNEAEMHTLLLPCCHGSRAIQVGKMALEYMLKTRGMKRVFGFCFSDCKAAIFFSRKIGLKFDCEVDHPNTRSGQKVTRLNFSINNLNH